MCRIPNFGFKSKVPGQGLKVRAVRMWIVQSMLGG